MCQNCFRKVDSIGGVRQFLFNLVNQICTPWRFLEHKWKSKYSFVHGEIFEKSLYDCMITLFVAKNYMVFTLFN